MRAKREVHRLSGYLMERAVWGAPSPPHKIVFCSSSSSQLPTSTLNRQLPEYQSLSITKPLQPISIICKLIQNGISKIMKSVRFNQFLLKNERLQPHYIDAGDIIYVDILPYNLAQKNCCYRPERSIHQSPDLVGSRIL